MPYDPASNAQALAELQARTDDKQFTLTSVSSDARFATAHEMQFAVYPHTDNRLFVSWSALYRGHPFGDGLGCDVADLELAKGLLLQWAKSLFDRLDLRIVSLGGGSNALEPNGAGLPDPPMPPWTQPNWRPPLGG